MHIPDDLDEPCAHDPEDAPVRFRPPQPPPEFSWWQGRWPASGINSLDDLKLWVECRLDEMIALQMWDTLADLGRAVGVQALKNADRYLGLHGDGDHPPRPRDDELQHVEDVEDALEAVLRHIGQKQRQPTAPAASSPPPSTATPPKPRKPRWVQADVDAAIRELAARHADRLAVLRAGAQADQKEAIEAVRAIVGRNMIARKFGMSKAQVSKSPVYRQLAEEYHLDRDGPVLNTSKAVGLDIAIEQKAMDEDDPVIEEVARREAADFIRKKLDDEDAQLLLGQLELGTISPDKAMTYALTMLTHRDDTRTRRKPS